MVAIAVSCEELEVEWLSGGRENQRGSGLWIYLALPEWALQGMHEHIPGATRLASLDAFHILFSPCGCQ